MTLLNLIPLRARERTEPASADDRSVLLMVALLLGLVFVPIIGLHIAAVAFDPEAAAILAGQPRPSRHPAGEAHARLIVSA